MTGNNSPHFIELDAMSENILSKISFTMLLQRLNELNKFLLSFEKNLDRNDALLLLFMLDFWRQFDGVRGNWEEKGRFTKVGFLK